MMGLSAILTGVFLFAYTSARTETQNLAFECVTGVLGNFGESPNPPSSRDETSTDILRNRIRRHVRLHARVLPGPRPRHGDGHGGDAAAVRRALCELDQRECGVFDRADLCERGAVGVCRGVVLWVAV